MARVAKKNTFIYEARFGGKKNWKISTQQQRKTKKKRTELNVQLVATN